MFSLNFSTSHSNCKVKSNKSKYPPNRIKTVASTINSTKKIKSWFIKQTYRFLVVWGVHLRPGIKHDSNSSYSSPTTDFML